MLNRFDNAPLWNITLAKLGPSLSEDLKSIRLKFGGNKYLGVFFANELTTTVEMLASCGLQRDIIKNISEGVLSYNTHWTSEIGTHDREVRLSRTAGGGPIARQLDVVFRNHKIIGYNLVVVKCNDTDRMIFLEANRKEGLGAHFMALSPEELGAIAKNLLLAHLQSYKSSHISDWEKAVHELASPLDFIYSNSDFLLYFLRSKDVPDTKKEKKLEDLKLVSRLLLNRLHLFRFAFAGVSNLKLKVDNVNIMKSIMPITHLFYHDAGSKGLRFIYDELRGHIVRSDEETIQFVAFNLISNAIKYSKRGTKIEVYADKMTSGAVRLGVRNVGLPISPEDQEKIFTLSFRAEDAKKWDARGLGVGLDVSQKLMREIGGSIRLVNGSGNKTVFEVEIPNLP